MANTRNANVIRIDTTAQINDVLTINSIKYIGNTSGTASIKAESTSGNLIWEESGASNVYNAEVELLLKNGLFVTVTNGAVLYLYLE